MLELVDIKGAVGMNRAYWELADIKGGGQKEFIDINRSQKILRGVAGSKSILRIFAI